jgi:hypothetical protein
MTRPLLVHESKLVEELLRDSGLVNRSVPSGLSVPGIVSRVLMDDRVSVNAGAMILFRQEATTKNCSVISCMSVIPQTTFGEFYLVVDDHKGEIAFVELISGPDLPRSLVQRLTKVVWAFCSRAFKSVVDEKLLTALEALQRYWTTGRGPLQPSAGVLKYIRIGYSGTTVVFMFSEAHSLFIQGGKVEPCVTRSDGVVQSIKSPMGKIAIDGWCHLSTDLWESMIEEEEAGRSTDS